MERESREQEISRLIAEQKRNDTAYQEPQRFGGERTVSWDKFADNGRDFGPDAEGTTVRDRQGPAPDGGATQRGVLRPNYVRPITRPRGREAHALARAIEPFLKGLTIPAMDAVRMVVYRQMSQREAAADLGISQPAVHKRLQSAASQLRGMIEKRAGSEGMQFPATRAFNEDDTCRLHPYDGYDRDCDGHFDDASCTCGTVLPTHYNPHTICRAHIHGQQTRHEYHLAWLIDLGLRALDEEAA